MQLELIVVIIGLMENSATENQKPYVCDGEDALLVSMVMLMQLSINLVSRRRKKGRGNRRMGRRENVESKNGTGRKRNNTELLV